MGWGGQRDAQGHAPARCFSERWYSTPSEEHRLSNGDKNIHYALTGINLKKKKKKSKGKSPLPRVPQTAVQVPHETKINIHPIANTCFITICKKKIIISVASRKSRQGQINLLSTKPSPLQRAALVKRVGNG